MIKVDKQMVKGLRVNVGDEVKTIKRAWINDHKVYDILEVDDYFDWTEMYISGTAWRYKAGETINLTINYFEPLDYIPSPNESLRKEINYSVPVDNNYRWRVSLTEIPQGAFITQIKFKQCVFNTRHYATNKIFDTDDTLSSNWQDYGWGIDQSNRFVGNIKTIDHMPPMASFDMDDGVRLLSWLSGSSATLYRFNGVESVDLTFIPDDIYEYRKQDVAYFNYMFGDCSKLSHIRCKKSFYDTVMASDSYTKRNGGDAFRPTGSSSGLIVNYRDWTVGNGPKFNWEIVDL